MSKYIIKKINTKKICVFETKTGQVIKTYRNNNKNQALTLCLHLNNSGGFNGETPNYFLDKGEQKTLDMNDSVR